jgi:hypothetical protein
MKKLIVLTSITFSAMVLFSGCIGIGNRSSQPSSESLGKQLTDLKGAEAIGAITPAEYETLKARLIGTK